MREALPSDSAGGLLQDATLQLRTRSLPLPVFLFTPVRSLDGTFRKATANSLDEKTQSFSSLQWQRMKPP